MSSRWWLILGICWLLPLCCLPAHAQPGPQMGQALHGLLGNKPLVPPTAAHGKQDPHAVLHGVLARSEFQFIKQPPQPAWLRWLQQQMKAAGNQLGRFFSWIGSGIQQFFKWIGKILHPFKWRFNNKPGPKWLALPADWWRYLLYGAIVIVVSLLGFLVYRLVMGNLKAKTPEVREDLLTGAAPVTRKQEPTYWERALQEAEALWQHGDQRQALRTLYLACLVLLDTRGVLRFDVSRANGEVLRELRRQGLTGVHEQLRPIVRCFDRSWYGFLNISSEEFTQVLENSRQFRGVIVKEP